MLRTWLKLTLSNPISGKRVVVNLFLTWTLTLLEREYSRGFQPWSMITFVGDMRRTSMATSRAALISLLGLPVHSKRCKGLTIFFPHPPGYRQPQCSQRCGSMLTLRGEGTVQVSKVKGHAVQAVADNGKLPQEDRVGNQHGFQDSSCRQGP